MIREKKFITFEWWRRWLTIGVAHLFEWMWRKLFLNLILMTICSVDWRGPVCWLKRCVDSGRHKLDADSGLISLTIQFKDSNKLGCMKLALPFFSILLYNCLINLHKSTIISDRVDTIIPCTPLYWVRVAIYTEATGGDRSVTDLSYV